MRSAVLSYKRSFLRERAARESAAFHALANLVSNIFAKLQVADRAAVIVRAQGASLGQP